MYTISSVQAAGFFSVQKSVYSVELLLTVEADLATINIEDARLKALTYLLCRKHNIKYSSMSIMQGQMAMDW